MATIQDGNAFVAGRDVQRVRRLLAIADELGIDPTLIRTQSGGYEVPSKIADAFEKEQADAAESEKPSAPKASARKTTAAKGTRSKKAASE